MTKMPSESETILAGDVDQISFEGGEVHYVFNEDRGNRRISDVISVRLAH